MKLTCNRDAIPQFHPNKAFNKHLAHVNCMHLCTIIIAENDTQKLLEWISITVQA